MLLGIFGHNLEAVSFNCHFGGFSGSETVSSFRCPLFALKLNFSSQCVFKTID